MSRKGLVSIIIPVYNTAPILLNKCLESVYSQTYENIEVLIIDDGSTENETIEFLNTVNADICKIIKKKNGGVSSARNKGLELAKGEYVFFLDSDDYIGDNTIRSLFDVMESGRYVEAISRQKTITANRAKIIGSIPEGVINIKNNDELILANTINFASHGTMVRSKIAKKYKFDDRIKYGEDFQYNYKVMSNGDSYYLNSCDYYYYQNPGSVLNSMNEEKALRYLEDFSVIYDEIYALSCHSDMVRYMMCDKINLTLKRLYAIGDIKYTKYRILAKHYRKMLIGLRRPRAKSSLHRDILVFLYYKKLYLLHFLATAARVKISIMKNSRRR